MPGKFNHMSDVRVEGMVEERVSLCVGTVKLRTARREKVPGGEETGNKTIPTW